MHTVIILNKHSSELLKDFRFLFKPFLDQKIISFCDWNESGTDIKSSVPDLYKLIKGKQEWRALVVNTDSMDDRARVHFPNEKNPFDFTLKETGDLFPKESEIPMIRLSHMVCGYPVSRIKNFEKGFEYYDDDGNMIRVRESDLSEEEVSRLSSTYGGTFKSIYMEERLPEGLKEAQDEFVKKYSFTDVRPREMLMVATRKHRTDEDHIYASWKTQFEMESSDFCSRNKYPSICRFLCYSITNPENSRYTKEIFEFWLSVLTLAINKIPASSLQAYKLYRLNVDVSKEELGVLLNAHLNKMEAAYSLVKEKLNKKPSFSFELDEDLIVREEIPVYYEGMSTKSLFINNKKIGLSRDCPEEEVYYWNSEINSKKKNLDKYLKSPRRAIDYAAQFLKDKTDSFYGEEYELDRFQVMDLEEKIQQLETDVLNAKIHNSMGRRKINHEVIEIDKKVKKHLAYRVSRNTVLQMGSLALVVFFISFIPYMINAYNLGDSQFTSSIFVTLFSLLFAAAGGMITLFILRHKTVKIMDTFNTFIKQVINDVSKSIRDISDYFTNVCMYMKAQSVHSGIKLKGDTISNERAVLNAHKKALQLSIARDEDFSLAYEISRKSDIEKNVSSFFNDKVLPKYNAIYYFEHDKSGMDIPLNKAGDLVETPYKFISCLRIEREDVFDDMEGDK